MWVWIIATLQLLQKIYNGALVYYKSQGKFMENQNGYDIKKRKIMFEKTCLWKASNLESANP